MGGQLAVGSTDAAGRGSHSTEPLWLGGQAGMRPTQAAWLIDVCPAARQTVSTAAE